MSEEYRLALDYCSALVAELTSTDQLSRKERASLLVQIAFLERLERLVAVLTGPKARVVLLEGPLVERLVKALEEIRDKPPASYTT